jgi:hypothetical protein
MEKGNSHLETGKKEKQKINGWKLGACETTLTQTL